MTYLLHGGQVRVPPQPSEITWPQVAWVHWASTQQVLLPCRQTWPPAHWPHERVLPQPSLMLPHCAFWAAQVVGVQHWPLTQSWLGAQLPASTVEPQPLE